MYPGTRWFIGRKELKRLMNSSYITFTKVCDYHKIPRSDWKLNGQYNYIEFKNGSRIDLLDLDYKPSDPEYDRFGSTEYTGGWIEEGAEVKFGAFDVLKTRIGRHLNLKYGLHPKMLITCNPGKNWLYKMIYKPWKANELPEGYAFIQSLYGDNPFTVETYGKMLAEIKDKKRKQRLMFGNWEYEWDPSALMEYDAILDMFTNTPIVDEHKYLTSDVARYGQDKTVIYLWKGFDVYKVLVFEKQGIDQTIDEIRTLLQNERIPYSHAIADEDGVGGGVVDGLRGIKGFTANSASLPNPETGERENYRNLKAQCSYMLARKINAREIGISASLLETHKEFIIEEIEQIRAKDLDRESPLQIIPKEEVKETIGHSPDFADTMVMRMYFDLRKPMMQQVTTQVPRWDGYGRIKK